MTDASKVEFDAALPALQTLLDQNQNNGVVRLEAFGHAYRPENAPGYSHCQVHLTVLGQIAE